MEPINYNGHMIVLTEQGGKVNVFVDGCWKGRMPECMALLFAKDCIDRPVLKPLPRSRWQDVDKQIKDIVDG